MNGTILIADDEVEIRESLSLILQDEGYQCITAGDGEKALDILMNDDIDILITDIRMPKIDGMELLKRTKEVSPKTLIILITAYATVQTAVESLRSGASDYLLKPLDFDEVLLRIKHLMRHKELEYENKFLRDQINQNYNFNFIIGESPAMKELYRMIKRVGKANTSVLITGRSGTGKELIARAIHADSDRGDKPFIPVNCGAIPENLFESELFGYRKGAFSGADKNKDGVFKAASGGTLFLDEIGDLPENVQVKLLRAIQEKEIRPLGANSAINVDVRLISATNKNLEHEVEEGRFREDLYYRINIIELKVPELSERKEDIPLLVRHFIDKYNHEFHREVKGANNEAMKILMLYKWKGQVRELENVIERAVLLTDDDYIMPADLPANITNIKKDSVILSDTDNLNDAIAAYERNHITNVLNRTDWNRSEAAKIMGIDPSTLSRKMAKLEIQNDSE